MKSWPQVGLISLGGSIDAFSGRRDEARAALRALEQRSKTQYVAPSYLASVLVGLGEREQAFSLLMRGCAERDGTLPNIRWDPVLHVLADDPRFPDLLRCMNLPPAAR